ncbi:diaminopimelate epimerase [Pseudomonas sp. CDFA 602]|uniref:diaminopimelate epimerase n=1 Tax=Pseudomonas californiensis TaxID=2829823 RepID=UPI001E2C76C6|nr:diaminopimelate epimerase [Pseudomonas californiensis]MCD5996658.1 diaminopimelate epimerase [Pseudomonas californiensis]MCD6002271.1 diaminopimelate epimerase [Pseudomonas californiensis]
MTRTYDARGNVYAVATPYELRSMGIAVPETARAAMSDRKNWAASAISHVCRRIDAEGGSKAHSTDGLLVGPFQYAAPFDLLIINTDGTLAERSGNGLTIFAQALTDLGHVDGLEHFMLNVHHDKGDALSPVQTSVQPANVDGDAGFWLDLGTPGFGQQAVGAKGSGVSCGTLDGRQVNDVQRLSDIDAQWGHSVFVRIGNPHCVTLVSTEQHLPSFAQLHAPDLNQALTAIAFSNEDVGAGDPCPAGINLQWAWVSAPDEIVARVFERGEGPTASSGTSASAVACAAWKTGSVKAGLVKVIMPGGTAPVQLNGDAQTLHTVALFGVAERKSAS